MFFLLGRDCHGCGVAQTSSNGLELIVAGGDTQNGTKSTEIYNFETNEWRAGQDLPHQMEFPASVQFGDSFLLVGGTNYVRHEEDGNFDMIYLDTIYQWDSDTESFALRPEKMSVGVTAVGAVMVTEDVVSCDSD